MFGGAIAALFVFEPPAGAREPLLILVGNLGSAFGLVVGYWYGSSSGSAQKNDLLAKGGSEAPRPPA